MLLCLGVLSDAYQHEFQLEKKVRTPPRATSDDGGEGADLSRRVSKRQQEKAPEGRAPHTNGDMSTHATDKSVVTNGR